MVGLSQNVDERVINKIHQLVGEGVQNVHEMVRHIGIYMSKRTCFVVLQCHHLQTADLILLLKMLKIIYIKWQLSISFQNWIRLI